MYGDGEGPDGNYVDDGVAPLRATVRDACGTSYRGRDES